MFIACLLLLYSDNCKVTDQVLDQVKRSDCWQTIPGELVISVIDLTFLSLREKVRILNGHFRRLGGNGKTSHGIEYSIGDE